MQATTMPKILAGLTRNSSTLSTKIARLRHTSTAAQYLSDVRKTYRLSMGSLFIGMWQGDPRHSCLILTHIFPSDTIKDEHTSSVGSQELGRANLWGRPTPR